MGKPTGGYTPVLRAESIGAERAPGELKHLSTPWKRNQRDSVSSGERTRTMPKPGWLSGLQAYATGGGCAMCVETTAVVSGSEKGSGQPKNLERFAIAGDSPVGDGWAPPWRAFASTAGHGKPRGKLGRPRSKAKYI
jgi:hypothetical protein